MNLPSACLYNLLDIDWWIDPFIHFTGTHPLPGSYLGIKGTIVSKTRKNPCPHWASILVRDKTQMNAQIYDTSGDEKS